MERRELVKRIVPSWTNALASFWGLAEATVFFIVPDVQLSWLALRSPKSGLVACLFALLGALVGGSVMWMWGRSLIPMPLGPSSSHCLL